MNASLPGKTVAAAAAMILPFLTADAEVQPPFPLWASGAPGALGTADRDIPTLTPYLPEPLKATGAAIVVLPGGGYEFLADHEGSGYAKWLSEKGIAAFVVKYRLGSDGYRHPIMLQDAARALRYVRSDAAKWKIDPKRIGIIGSSAGGHLASTLLTHFDEGKAAAPDLIDRVSDRPDLGILCYPVISMGPDANEGTKKNLLGPNPSPDLVENLSNEKQVTKNTPPCFLFHTSEDQLVNVENSLAFAEALHAHGVPFDLHVYQKGGHGVGLGEDPKNPGKYHPWTSDLLYWLRVQGFIK